MKQNLFFIVEVENFSYLLFFFFGSCIDQIDVFVWEFGFVLVILRIKGGGEFFLVMGSSFCQYLSQYLSVIQCLG